MPTIIADRGCNLRCSFCATTTNCPSLPGEERQRGVLIGFESITQASLKSVYKRYRQVDNFREIVDRFHAHHIAVNGCWVLGFDHDTEESILAMPERIRGEIGCDLTRFAIMTPLPGSRMFDRLEEEGRIIDYNWDHYDQRHAVFQPTNMSPRRLEQLNERVWREAYRMNAVLGRVRNPRTGRCARRPTSSAPTWVSSTSTSERPTSGNPLRAKCLDARESRRYVVPDVRSRE